MISDGSILGIVPKTHLPNYSEFYELRHFTSGEGLEEDLWFGEEFGYVNVAVNQLFKCKEIPELVVACEICEDLWVPLPPSTYHAMAGATVICNPSASVETTTKDIDLFFVNFEFTKNRETPKMTDKAQVNKYIPLKFITEYTK